MYQKLDYCIQKISQENNSAIYNVGSANTYIVSNKDSRELLCNPEITGYNIPQKLFAPIKDTIHFLNSKNLLNNINIVNILRGGLNFPLERACFDEGLDVDEISFLTSERIFLDDKVSRIEAKYRKIADVPNAAIIIGDIIASGETLCNTVKYIVEKYVHEKIRINKIIIFTIGTSNTLDLIYKLEHELKERWDDFQGIYTFFFEAVFTAYSSRGITDLNLPYVDFKFSNGLLAPEYRKALIQKPNIVFEKCAIYDGGARRFEKKIHIQSISKYWYDLCLRSEKISLQELFNEKMGYKSFSNYPNYLEWIKQNRYEKLDQIETKNIYSSEESFFHTLQNSSMTNIATKRYNELISYYCIN